MDQKLQDSKQHLMQVHDTKVNTDLEVFCLDISLVLFFVKQKPKLFDGLKFYFYEDFFKGYKEDFKNLVKVAGDTILKTEDELSAEDNVGDQRSSTIVVYNIDPRPGCGLGEEVTIIWERANEAETLSSKTWSRVVWSHMALEIHC